MGCFSSSQERPESIPLNDSSQPLSIVTGGNKPLLKLKSYVPKFDETAQEILKKRNVFWDTQPSYSGRIEIWQMLRLACEAESIETAQAIVDSANITCPTGRFTDGCYDELGNMYVIPGYCLGPLDDNVYMDQKPKEKLKVEIAEEHVDPAQLFEAVCRLSTGIDVSVQIAPSHTICQLKEFIGEKQGWNETTCTSSIVILFGKRYEPNMKISDTPIDGSALVQVMVLQK
jgi:hypothetical protein